MDVEMKLCPKKPILDEILLVFGGFYRHVSIRIGRRCIFSRVFVIPLNN